jgi:hypothetical protein
MDGERRELRACVALGGQHDLLFCGTYPHARKAWIGQQERTRVGESGESESAEGTGETR